MGVIMQTFYWDCPKQENKVGEWWNFVNSKIASLSSVGFTALWLPPANKAANLDGLSMGYDPYDYYDLGDIDQKGSLKTLFGSKTELLELIKSANDNNMQVYADLVINHNSGADDQEVNLLTNEKKWTKFTPKSNKFPRNWKCFHPSPYETWDNGTFGEMPDLCHRDPYVYTEMLEYARWLIEDIGFNGFRYDCVKGYGGWMIRAIQELRGLKNDISYKPFGVGECWDSDRNIREWLDETNAWSDNPVSAFDFPLRYRLKDLCETYGFSLKNLLKNGTLLTDSPSVAVTFVENHDVVRDDPVINDKMLAYAFILTHEGYPCVFWQDYYNWNLAQEDNFSGITALVQIHEKYAGGTTSVLYVDDNLYIMQRNGFQDQRGLIFVLNNQNSWSGTSVQTKWENTRFVPMAWRGEDIGTSQEKYSEENGWADFWAPPRGYCVYIPQI